MSLSLFWALLIKAPLMILSTIVMGSLSVFTSFFDKEARLPDRIARCWARMLLAIGGVKVRLGGLDRFGRNKPYVFVSNHHSLIDTPVVLASVPVRFLFLVHAKYVRWPFLGTHLRRSGHFSVEEDNVRSSLKSMTAAAAAVRARGISILLFPEGSRAAGAMDEFKEGAAYIAIKAGVPVVPFALNGTRAILPIGSIHVRSGPVDLVFGDPIPTEGLTLKDRDRLTKLMRERISELLAGMDDQPGAGRTRRQPVS